MLNAKRMITNEDLIKLGFTQIPHFTIGNNVVFDLGRNRYLSASGVGTPNEFLYINDVSEADSRKIENLICIHNFDYDGYLTIEKVEVLLKFFSSAKKNEFHKLLDSFTTVKAHEELENHGRSLEAFDFNLERQERNLIKMSLNKHKGVRSKTARELGIAERTLYRKLRKYELI